MNLQHHSRQHQPGTSHIERQMYIYVPRFIYIYFCLFFFTSTRIFVCFTIGFWTTHMFIVQHRREFKPSTSTTPAGKFRYPVGTPVFCYASVWPDLRFPLVERMEKILAEKLTYGTCISKIEQINKKWKTGNTKIRVGLTRISSQLPVSDLGEWRHICHFFRWQKMWRVTFVTFLGRMWRSCTRKYFCNLWRFLSHPSRKTAHFGPAGTKLF